MKYMSRALAKGRLIRIRKGKITLSFPALPSENLSYGEFADRKTSSLLVNLDNEIRENSFGIKLIVIEASKATWT